MMNKKLRTISLVLLCSLLLSGGILYGLISYKISQQEDNKQQSKELLTKALSRKLDYERRTFEMVGIYPAFVFTNVRIAERDNDNKTFLQAKRVVCRISPLPLLWGKSKITKLTFENTTLAIIRAADGIFNIVDLLSLKTDTSLEIAAIDFENSILLFEDNKLNYQQRLLETNAHLANIGSGKQGKIFIQAVEQNSHKKLSLKGVIQMPPPDEPDRHIFWDIKASFAGVELEHLSRLIKEHLPPWAHNWKSAGNLDFQARFIGTPISFWLSLHGDFQDLIFSHPQAFLDDIKAKHAKISFVMNKKEDSLGIRNISVDIDGTSLAGTAELNDLKGDDPYLDIRIHSPNICLQKATPYIPYRIIPEPVANFIQQHITQAKITLKEGRLSGHISEIANIDSGDNHRCLYIDALVKDGVVTYGENFPSFNHISGVLKLEGRYFLLKSMQGYYGKTPLKGEGRITNYNAPLLGNSYDFNTTAKPTAAEISTLSKGYLTQGKGASLLSFNGSGGLDKYRLSASWDLTNASFRILDKLEKPLGLPSRISVSGLLGPDGFLVENTICTLGSARLEAVPLKSPPKGETILQIRSNDIDMGEMANLLKKDGNTSLTGKARVNLLARGNIGGSGAQEWKIDSGNVTFYDLTAVWKFIDITKANGALVYVPGLNPRLSVQGTLAGGSQWELFADIDSFTNRSVLVRLNAPRLVASDIGYAGSIENLFLTDVKSLLLLANNTLEIRALSGRYNANPFALSGSLEIPSGAESDYRLSFRTGTLSVADFSEIVGVPGNIITGRINISGNLTLSPANETSPFWTPKGKLAIQAKDGVIIGFPTIYKLFGALNILHYLKLKLPETDAEGMPYNTIEALLIIDSKEAIIKRAFITSSSLNLTIIGRVLLRERTLNLLIGVHPFQNLDKVVSSVPIIGWLLTKDRKFLTLFFTVTGPIADPQVRATPIKSLAGGIWDILTKTIKLPIKIFTDTNEVILGE